MKNLIKFIKVAIFVLALLLIGNILKNDFNSDDFKKLILKADYLYLINTIVIVFISIILKGHRLQIISKQFEIFPSFFEAVKIQIISITFAMITPGRAGEFTKIFLLAKEDKKKLPLTTVICVFERLIDVIILSLAGTILCMFTLNDIKILSLLLLLAICIIMSLFLLFNLGFFMKKFEKYIPNKIKTYVDEFEIHKSKIYSKTPLIVLYSTFIWVIDAFFQWSILKSVGSSNSIWPIFGINGITAIMGILTILPMGLGTVDISALYLYDKILNVPHEKIVFLLASYRFFGIGTLILMLLPIMVLQKGFVESIYNKTIKKNIK
ncbi:MAG: lysylphosphatidylglycerol synthase transmembrane domain-containing protein [Cyanobacteriota bacterium]